jgi:hypothetical protein
LGIRMRNEETPNGSVLKCNFLFGHVSKLLVSYLVWLWPHCLVLMMQFYSTWPVPNTCPISNFSIAQSLQSVIPDQKYTVDDCGKMSIGLGDLSIWLDTVGTIGVSRQQSLPNDGHYGQMSRLSPRTTHVMNRPSHYMTIWLENRNFSTS